MRDLSYTHTHTHTHTHRTKTGTTRPMSMAGRFVRLGTASMLGNAQEFINVDRDVQKDVKKPWRAKALVDYFIYHEHNYMATLKLAAEGTKAANFEDWWWKARLGKAYYQLSMFREAMDQFNSAIRQQPMIVSYLELAKIYLRIDQPMDALQTYQKGLEKFPGDVALTIGIARVHEALQDADQVCVCVCVCVFE
jgi:tetratricopeptide repeat protein 8